MACPNMCEYLLSRATGEIPIGQFTITGWKCCSCPTGIMTGLLIENVNQRGDIECFTCIYENQQLNENFRYWKCEVCGDESLTVEIDDLRKCGAILCRRCVIK